jgi:hypothetical protein
MNYKNIFNRSKNIKRNEWEQVLIPAMNNFQADLMALFYHALLLKNFEITLDISTLYFISHFSIMSKIKYKNGYVILSPPLRALVVPQESKFMRDNYFPATRMIDVSQGSFI